MVAVAVHEAVYERSDSLWRPGRQPGDPDPHVLARLRPTDD